MKKTQCLALDGHVGLTLLTQNVITASPINLSTMPSSSLIAKAINSK